jgi:hypothetical protein
MTMTDEEDYAAEDAAEAAAAQWWDPLRERSVGTCHIQEWTYLWIGVMLRRVAAVLPGSGNE